MSEEAKTRETHNAVALGREQIVYVNTLNFNSTVRSNYQRADITFMRPSVWEEGTGYGPAESVQFQLYRQDLVKLIQVLQEILE